MAAAPGYPLMHGPQFAKAYVNNYLAEDIPVRIIDYRNGWGVDDITLPTPESYITYEPIAIDTWPLIVNLVISTSGFDRIGFDGPDPLYRVTYVMRTYVWTKTEGPEEATIMRDRLTTVVRAALLDHPCMRAYDERNSFRAMIDESSVREEFSDLTMLKGDRVMAGAYVGYNMEIDEVVSRKPIGAVSEIQLTVLGSGSADSIPELTAD